MINNYDDYIEAKFLEEQGITQNREDYSTYEFLQFINQDSTEFYNEFRLNKSDEPRETKQIFHSMFENNLPFEELYELNKEGYNIYYGPATRKEEKGNKESVYEVSVLFVDIDLNTDENRQTLEQQIEKRTKETGLIPSIIVDSGNGFHLYFKLKKNIKILTDEDRQLVEGVSRWLAEMFGGDNICDLSRVMRLPGFYNNKDPQSPKKCAVVKFNKDALYNLSDFGTIHISQSNIEKIELGEIPAEIPKRFLDLLESDKFLKNTWLGQREDLSKASGSEYDMSLASKLVRKDEFTNEEIAKVLLETPYEKTNPRTKPYLEHTISKARSSYDGSSDYVTEKKGLSALSLMPTDFDESKVEYLIDGFLPKDTLMLMTGSYGVGKSYFTLALTKKLIQDGNTVVIVDVDMPRHIIHERLETAGMLKHLGDRLNYIHSTNFPFKIDTKNSNWCEFKRRIEVENNAIIIFDNMKELFPSGEDLNVDSNVIPVMNELKEVRDMHNTVILIHHVGKESSSQHPFKNSGSIADSVDIAYYLNRKGDGCSLKNFKSRVQVDDKVKFFIEPDFTLKTKDIEQDDAVYNNMIALYELLKEKCIDGKGMFQKELIDEMSGVLSKEKVREALNKGEDMLWNMTRGKSNSHIYTPIEMDLQKSKSLPLYIRKSLGFLENEEDIATIQEESPLELPVGENLRS